MFYLMFIEWCDGGNYRQFNGNTTNLFNYLWLVHCMGVRHLDATYLFDIYNF